MNNSGYSEGDVTMQYRESVSIPGWLALAVMLAMASLIASQGHAQALRSVEQQENLEADFESGALESETSGAGENNSPDQASENATNQPGGGLTRDRILAILANEVVLAPGIGLQHIRLGESLDSVKSRLGPPQSISRTGFLPRYYVLGYLLDGGTRVQLVGRKVVERIRVTGNSAALIRTAQGARFGMDPSLIQSIYHGPTKQRRNRLEYRDRGITFYFAEQGSGQGLSDGVSRIEIYQPGARGSG